MEPSSKVEVDEMLPTPPPYISTDESQTGKHVRIYHINSPFSPPPPPPPPPSFSFSGCSTQTYTPPSVSALPPTTPRLKFVSYEMELSRSPALTMCPSCQTWVTTQVTYQVGIHVWLMCLVFVLCGMVLGCCLIPFFVNYFKDAYHTCPRCRRILGVHRKTCCV